MLFIHIGVFLYFENFMENLGNNLEMVIKIEYRALTGLLIPIYIS